MPLQGIAGRSRYRIAAPLDTHYRVASCAESDCSRYREGFTVIVDESTDLGQAQAAHLRADRERRHRETRNEAGLTVFMYAPGQECFNVVRHDGRPRHGHYMPIQRPELYLVHSTGSDPVLHSGPDAWVDDFCTNQDRVARLING
ncbi:hypothetical protein GCM10027258_62310 [Amycolatopsis stemonae]